MLDGTCPDCGGSLKKKPKSMFTWTERECGINVLFIPHESTDYIKELKCLIDSIKNT